MPAVNPIGTISFPELSPAGGTSAGGFRSVLESAIGKVEQPRAEAAKAVENYLAGEGEELHSVMLATQRAELALELFLQTRNKVVQAYQEIMRTQV